jgi:hypothetical protein
LQLSGAAVAAVRLDELAADSTAPEDIRLAAAVLAAIAYRDAARPDLAGQVIARMQSSRPLLAAFALVHLAVAQRELGDAAAAFQSCKAAEAALRGNRESPPLAEAVRTAISRNMVVFGFAAGDHGLALTRRRTPHARVLEQIESRVASGLASWLEQEFDGRFEDPTTSSMTFRQEDPVQTPLIGALLRAEVLGDWQLTREARKRLGRYQLLASLGEAQRAPVSALHLLRRSGDVKGLARALRWYRAEGPLPPLREFGDAIARMPWVETTLQADLTALRGSADLMGQTAANMALARVLVSLGSIVDPRQNVRLESEVNAAVASLLSVAPDGHGSAAKKYLPVVEGTNDVLFLQSVGPVLERIDWNRVPRPVLKEWSEYCKRHLAGVDDHRFPATALVRSLPASDELHAAALDAWRRQPDLLTAANVLVLRRAPSSLVRRVIPLAIGELDRIRADARAGTHGFGAYIDAPLLLTQVLLDYPGYAGWRVLSAFLRDPVVAPSKKTGPIREILRRSAEVPASIHRSLAAWVRKEVQYAQIPMETVDEFKGAVLRLRFRYRARPAEVLLTELLLLATSEARSARHEAAETLPFVGDQVAPATLLTLALTLSKDDSWEVRGPASSILPRLASLADAALAGLVWSNLQTTLRDPGAIVPLWVLNRLVLDSPPDLPPEIVAVVGELAEHHLSSSVRAAARNVMTRIEGTPTT